MPNHIHGIIAIVVGAPLAGARYETGGVRNETGGDGKVRAPLAGARYETGGDGRG